MSASAARGAAAFSVLLSLGLTSMPLRGQAGQAPDGQGLFQQRAPDFERQLQQQAETDKTWRAASDGFMQMEKITDRSRAGDMDIPAFVFQPLTLRGAKGHPAIVWVHENIRGHLYEHYIREATAKGYLVIAPEYRGSIGYDRSPLYSVDKLQIPLHVGVTKNDEDVNIEEDMQIVDALRACKPGLAETVVYDNPPGGHTFDRRVDPKTWQPENTREQRDSWNRVGTFLDWNLDPFHAAAPTSTK